MFQGRKVRFIGISYENVIFVGGRCLEAVLQVGWVRVGGGLVSPQAFALGGDKPRPYATLSWAADVHICPVRVGYDIVIVPIRPSRRNMMTERSRLVYKTWRKGYELVTNRFLGAGIADGAACR